jgi:hypothetical protein
MHRRALVTGALAAGIATRLAAAQQPAERADSPGAVAGLPRMTEAGARRDAILHRRLGRPAPQQAG